MTALDVPFVIVLYFFAAAGFVVFAWRQNPVAGRWAYRTLTVGLGVQTAGLIARTAAFGQVPVFTFSQALYFFGWAVALAYVVLTWRHPVHIMGAVAGPAAFLLAAVAAMAGVPVEPLSPGVKNIWLTVHLATLFAGYGFFFLAFAAGLMYLLLERQIKSKRLGGTYHRLPSLSALDQLNHFCLVLGFPLLTLGIVTGMFFAQISLGTYWRWDPKEVWALLLWLFYAALLHQRLTVGWRGRRAAMMAIIGFLVVCFTFVGVSLLLPGYHSFESLRRIGLP